MYYDSKLLRSHNCLFNYVVSERGPGKTYDFKDKGIKAFLKDGSEFVYIRRYKSEFKKLKTYNTFFRDIEDKYPDNELKVQGDYLLCDGKIMGYFIPLSVANTFKSSPFPKVTSICFDEFIIAKGHIRYLDNEVVTFLDLYSTIARKRDVPVYFLANAISIINPYFLYFNIFPSDREFTKKGDLIIQMPDNKVFKESMQATRFGKLIQGTDYGDYAIENKFYLDNDDFIEEKSKASVLNVVIVNDGVWIGFWFDYDNNVIYSSKKHDKQHKNIYTFSDSGLKDNALLIRNAKQSKIVSYIVVAYKNGLLRYSDKVTKDHTLKILSKIMF